MNKKRWVLPVIAVIALISAGAGFAVERWIPSRPGHVFGFLIDGPIAGFTLFCILVALAAFWLSPKRES